MIHGILRPLFYDVFNIKCPPKNLKFEISRLKKTNEALLLEAESKMTKKMKVVLSIISNGHENSKLHFFAAFYFILIFHKKKLFLVLANIGYCEWQNIPKYAEARDKIGTKCVSLESSDIGR